MSAQKLVRLPASFRVLALVGAAGILAATAGCKQAESPVSHESEAATATGTDGTGPAAKPGISASDGHLFLPVVPGRPGAVYFTVRNDGPAAAKLVGVHVSGSGSAKMHKTDGGTMTAIDSLDIAPGAQVEFKQGGMHVMVFDIEDSVKASGTAELTLTFSDGDKLSMPLRVESMGGDGMGDMPGMEH
ncbi:copper chaperone PCu(A)C [Novosphingobium sp. ZW T3_23]|uniref:copper chaperone PCu(A)C n=1 Tax=Novosphingobium sp. ZW T3_23 TaxID=3378084 RepID=UPI0038526110